MTLLSVDVSLPREVTYGGRTGRPGIFEKPVEERIMLQS